MLSMCDTEIKTFEENNWSKPVTRQPDFRQHYYVAIESAYHKQTFLILLSKFDEHEARSSYVNLQLFHSNYCPSKRLSKCIINGNNGISRFRNWMNNVYLFDCCVEGYIVKVYSCTQQDAFHVHYYKVFIYFRIVY